MSYDREDYRQEKDYVTNQDKRLVKGHWCTLLFQNTQEIKENAFYLDETGQNVHIFEEVLFFKLRATYKQKKQIIDLIYLVSVRCGRLAEAKGHETDWRDKEYTLV